MMWNADPPRASRSENAMDLIDRCFQVRDVFQKVKHSYGINAAICPRPRKCKQVKVLVRVLSV
jgi:hypothetical protein